MRENEYFQQALANFTYEVAGGGAIRHLTEAGYTVKQIMEQLDFPVPYEKVRRAVWEHLVRTRGILLEEPGSGTRKEKAVYVREYDKYGKCSFRRVVREEEASREIHWRELPLERDLSPEQVLSVVRAKVQENGDGNAYVSCSFGILRQKEPHRYRSCLQCLEERQREYLEGLPWENREVYHRLDLCMMEILEKLCTAGFYQGRCYFLVTGDTIKIGQGDME